MLTVYETQRLLLKIENERIYSKVLNFYNDNKDLFEKYEPTRCLNFYTLAYQRNYLSMEQQEMNEHKMIRLWIYTKADPSHIIGTISFCNITQGAFMSATLGYKLDKGYQGQGYAYEACIKGLDIMRHAYHIHRIEARIMPSNKNSMALINHLGFRFEGIEYKSVEINHQWEDHMRFAIVF